MCAYIPMYVCVYVYLCIMHVCECMHVYLCMYVCMYTYVCMLACMYVYVSIGDKNVLLSCVNFTLDCGSSGEVCG